jgi:hypothetical protein
LVHTIEQFPLSEKDSAIIVPMDRKESFAARYAQLSDADISEMALSVRSLILPAREALKDEMLRRHLSVKHVNWGARPFEAYRPYLKKSGAVGDKAGEHLEMEHGKYAAWIHVAIAFLSEVMLFAYLVREVLELVLHFPAGDPVNAFALICGSICAIVVYSNRWLCIENYASQHCTGLLNVSILYVPVITFIYANYRGIRKLLRK